MLIRPRAQVRDLASFPGGSQDIAVDDMAELRLYQGAATAALVKYRSTFGDKGGGPFVVKPGDTTTADDGALVIVDARGRRWWRVYSGSKNMAWWGPPTDGDDAGQTFQDAIDSIPLGEADTIVVPPGEYTLTTPITENGRFPFFIFLAGATVVGTFTLNFQQYYDDGIKWDNGNFYIGSNDANLGRGTLVIGGGAMHENTGTYLFNDGHAGLLTAQSTIRHNPTELIVYGNATGGVATSDGSDVLVAVDAVFTDVMIGHTFWFRGTSYTVLDVPSANTVQLSSTIPAATGTWNFVLTTGSGTCRIVGTSIFRTSGDPFLPFTSDPTFEFEVNGTPITVTFSSVDLYIASAPPGDTAEADWFFSIDINQQIATQRLQRVYGTSESTYATYARPDAYYHQAQATGFGELIPVRHDSEYETVLELAAYGKYVSLGGISGAEAARFKFAENAENRFEFEGGTSGNAAVMQATGPGADAKVIIATKGAGSARFMSHDRANVEYEIDGAGATGWLATGSHNSAPYIQARGTGADVRLIGAGGGGVELMDSAFAAKFKIDTTGIAFFAGLTAGKQTVTGSKGANAALGSLLTALAAYGLITDSSS